MRLRCQEIPELIYDDGLEFLYFYTGGHKGGNNNIKAMLNYFQNSTRENVTDRTTEDISEIVEQVRNLPKVRNEYMTLGDIIDMEREEATEEATRKAAEKEKQKLNDMTRNHILMYFQSKGVIPDGLVDELKEIDDAEQLQSCYEKALEMQEINDYIQFLRNVRKRN